MAEKQMGHSQQGYSATPHLFSYAGGQAEYARVPFADVGLFKIPDGLTDEQVLFLTDLPTGYMAAENCKIKPGIISSSLGCGASRTVRD